VRALLVALVAAAALGLAACDDDSTPPPPVDMSAVAAAGDMAHLAPECDVLTNHGCPAGQRCTIGTDHGSPRDLCFPVAAAPLADGAVCAPVVMGDVSGDDCAPGLACIAYAGDGLRCRRPCYLRADCAAGFACVARTATGTLAQTDGGVFDLRGCIAATGCDPIAQDVCSGGLACYLSLFDDIGRVGVCLQPGTGGSGASCNVIPDCAPGFRCEGLGFCRRYCYFEPNADGGAGTSAGVCPAGEGQCDRFSFSGGRYGVCGSQ
jgi:hypothetical protein